MDTKGLPRSRVRTLQAETSILADMTLREEVNNKAYSSDGGRQIKAGEY